MQTSTYMSYLYHHGQVYISEIVKMYPHDTPRSIYKHCKQKPTEKMDKRKFNSWPKKGLVRNEGLVVRSVGTLRKEVDNIFGAKKVQNESGIDHVCDRTIRRCLKQKSLFQCTTQEKRNCICKILQEKETFFSEMFEKIKTRLLDKMCKFLFRWRRFHTQIQPNGRHETIMMSRLAKT